MLNRLAHRLNLRETWSLHLMLLPAVVLLVIFAYIPMSGISIAFQDYLPTKGFYGSPWIGLENFKYLLNLPDVFMVISNTLIISILKIVLTLFAALVFALLVNEVRLRLFQRAFQTVFLFPYFLSWVVLGGIFIDILAQNGAVNIIIKALGFKYIFFMGNPQWFRGILVSTHVWKEFGYSMIMFLAAMTSIDPCLYESAIIDGANRWKQTLHITIPGISGIIVLLSVLSLGGILNAGFDQIFVMYNPLVYSTSDIIDTYVYRIGVLNAQYSLATAVGLFKSLVGFILITTSYKLADKFANYRVF